MQWGEDGVALLALCCEFFGNGAELAFFKFELGFASFPDKELRKIKKLALLPVVNVGALSEAGLVPLNSNGGGGRTTFGNEYVQEFVLPIELAVMFSVTDACVIAVETAVEG